MIDHVSHPVSHDHDHNTTTAGDVDQRALAAVRVTAMLANFALAVVVGLFVIRYGGKHRITGSGRWYHVLLRYATPFTGGLFLALAVIHVFPEANEAMDAAYGEDVNDQYRLGPLMATFAFVLLTFIEKFFGAPHSHGVEGDRDGADNDADIQENDDAKSEQQSISATTAVTKYSTMEVRSSSTRGSAEHADDIHGELRAERRSLTDAEPHPSASRDVDRLQRSGKVEDALVRTALDVSSASGPKDADAGEGALALPLALNTSQPLVDAPFNDNVPPRTRMIRSIVLIIALALHSVAEGLALGLASDVSDAVVFFVAIFIHKWGEPLAIGNSLALSPLSSRECTIAIVLFSLATPLGIGLGWAAQEFLPDTVNAVLEAFTVGTFIYLAMEVYVEEFGVATKNVGRKFFAYILGIALIYGATVISE